jgi:hypothetical protein
MIGNSFGDARDIHPTPLGMMPGSLILLNAVSSLLRYGEFPTLPVHIKLLIVTVLITIISVVFIRFHGFWGVLLVCFLTYVAFIPLFIWLYHKGIWVELDIVFPLFVVQLRHILSEFRMVLEFNVFKAQIMLTKTSKKEESK